MTRTRLWPTAIMGLTLALTGCDDGGGDADADDPQGDDPLAEYCEQSGECGGEKADGFVDGFVAFVARLALVATDQLSWTELGSCVAPERFDHFVDMAREDDVPRFTSVQDFTIERTDITAMQVMEAFREDWLVWWKDGTARDGSTGPLGDDHFGIAIRPLGLSLVEIEMDVGVPVENPDHPAHPELENPDLDRFDGRNIHWDAALQIEMSGNAFHGTMLVFAEETEDGIHVRETWYRTQPVAPLVMVAAGKWPLSLTIEERLRLAAFLHIAATQGCALPRGTGYPGLIEAFEFGDLPAEPEGD